jgi:hypothetical protein
MVRKVGLWSALVLAAVVGPAAGASASPANVAVPESVGMMGAAEAPAPPDDSPFAPLLLAVGTTLLLGGGITVARSWVSPKVPV